ncbi:TPA: hypothetical protein ACPVXB_005066 [Vibrio parahaemolyticus]
MNITQHEKYQATAEVFKSLNTIRGFIDSLEHFEDLEKMYEKFTKCFDEAKDKEEARIAEEEAKMKSAEDALEILEGMGLSVEEFNRLLVRSGRVLPSTFPDDLDAIDTKPRAPKQKREKSQPAYVFQYEVDGEVKRTPLRGATGRKPAEMDSFMKARGLNSYSPEDCMTLVVDPTQEEIDAFLKSGGKEELIHRIG